MNVCRPTKAATNNYEPEVFSPSNNLLKRPGAMELYCGQKILLKLKVLDKDCVPISDAKIYLWQVGCDGKYPYKPLRTKVNKGLLNIHNRSSFVGSGIATSDNLGKAQFITLYPPTAHGESFINLRIEHKDYGTFQTKIRLHEDMLHDDGNHEIVSFRIVTPWKNLFRGY
jgi:protocatechuate 3,4-dioxygenase beta subunit